VYDIHVFYVINLQVQYIINSELIRCLDSVLLKFYQCTYAKINLGYYLILINSETTNSINTI